MTCLDLITQSNPLLSLNECVLCLHLQQKTQMSAGETWTRWWNMFFSCYTHLGALVLFSVFLRIYELELSSSSSTAEADFVGSFAATVNNLKTWTGVSCMLCSGTILGEHLKSNQGTEDGRSDTYWQLSYDFDPLRHIRRLCFWKLFFFTHFKVLRFC